MRVFRWLLIVVGLVAVLIALGITLGGIWLNTFIHSADFRHEVEARATQTVGGPVQIREINFDFLRGVKLRGVVTQMDAAHLGGSQDLSAQVETVDCTYSLSDLLHKRLKLTGVTLEKPQIILTRQILAPASRVEAPSSTSTSADQAALSQSAPFQFILERAKIHDGSLSIHNRDGVPVIVLNGVDGEAETSLYYEGKDITGKVKIADLAFPNFHLTDVTTPWVFDPHGNFVTTKPMEASGFGGRLAGDFILDGTGPSVLDINVNGLDAALVGRTFQPESAIRLSGSLDGQSKWHGVESGHALGEGDLQLSGGKLQGVRLLQQLSDILRVRELAEPKLNTVHTHFEVADGRTRFTGLQADGGTFQMTGDGVIGAGGALDAHMVLILSADAMARLPREAAAFFVQQPNGSGSIAYHLGGTISNPQTDLGTRILMQGAAVKNVISNAINRFFHKHEKAAVSPNQTTAAPMDQTNAAPAAP